MSSVHEFEKKTMRRQMRATLASMNPEQRAGESVQINELLQQHWSGPRVLLYAPLPREVDVWPSIHLAVARWGGCALPRVAGPALELHWVDDPQSQLIAGPFGILQPHPSCASVGPEDLTCVVVPGLAFSTHGDRLGRGGGYYDRLLTRVGCPTLGVAFRAQIVGHIPMSQHDQPVRRVIHEKRPH
jgi:5-formyltetrahydrofolate cyclo-ligase